MSRSRPDQRGGHPFVHKWWTKVPKDVRKHAQRSFRQRTRQAIIHQRYDDVPIPTEPYDVAWYWW